MTAPDSGIASTECTSCGGAGWKYATQRSEMRSAAVECRPMVQRRRKPCRECGGRDQIAESS